MMAEGLAHAAEPFAADRDDRVLELLCHAFGYSLDIVTDQSYRTFREYTDALCKREELLQLMECCVKTLVTAVYDILLLKVCGDMHGAEGIDAGLAVIVVAARPPAVLAAAYGAVADRDLVFYRPPDNTLCACIRAAPDRHNARSGLDVRLYLTGAALT